MSGYVRSIEVRVPFDGQDVRVVLKPLTRGDLFQLQALLPRDKDDPNKLVVDPVSGMDAFDLYAKKLPDYIVESNVTDNVGAEISVAEWAGSAYFIGLVTSVMLEHMGKAIPVNP